MELPIRAEAIGDARRGVQSFDAVDPDLHADVGLLLTELVANAVKHSGLDDSASLEVTVGAAPGYVWVEVHNPGREIVDLELPIEPPSAGADSGYGLLLVDRLARRWGVLAGGGARVWFELDRTG
jgi:anti-sigma regulatory factor (Ser/Thr protein kinase)